MAITVTQALQKTYMIHGKTLSADELDMWMLVLRSQNIAEHDAISALLKLLGESKFLPKPADVVEIAQGNTKAQQDYEAYRALQVVIKAVNPYSRPVFEDPRCSHLMAFLGGNVAMANMQADDLSSSALRAQARDFFKSLPKDVKPKKLDKMLDGDNYHYIQNTGEMRPISKSEYQKLTGERETITTAQAIIKRIAG
jgi:hypothetical protein